MRNFLVTIKGHGKRHYAKSELDVEWAYLRAMTDGFEWSEHAVYEVDSIGRMHLHTTCRGAKAPYFKKLQKPGWSLHFKEYPAHDRNKVQKYLAKHSQNKNAIKQLFWENELEWAPYLFTDSPDLLGPAGYEAIGNGDSSCVDRTENQVEPDCSSSGPPKFVEAPVPTVGRLVLEPLW